MTAARPPLPRRVPSRNCTGFSAPKRLLAGRCLVLRHLSRVVRPVVPEICGDFTPPTILENLHRQFAQMIRLPGSQSCALLPASSSAKARALP